MPNKGRSVRYTAEELAALPSETDWAFVNAMSQEEVERIALEEDGPLPESWEKTIILGVPEPKKDVHIRLDPAVLRWFKAAGPRLSDSHQRRAARFCPSAGKGSAVASTDLRPGLARSRRFPGCALTHVSKAAS